MEHLKIFQLKDLVDPPNTNSISGRGFGEEYARKIELLKLVDEKLKIEFEIDPEYIKAINDSFIKGLFSKVFEKYKTIDFIKSYISIVGTEYFKSLFEKNWLILQEINNV